MSGFVVILTCGFPPERHTAGLTEEGLLARVYPFVDDEVALADQTFPAVVAEETPPLLVDPFMASPRSLRVKQLATKATLVWPFTCVDVFMVLTGLFGHESHPTALARVILLPSGTVRAQVTSPLFSGVEFLIAMLTLEGLIWLVTVGVLLPPFDIFKRLVADIAVPFRLALVGSLVFVAAGLTHKCLRAILAAGRAEASAFITDAFVIIIPRLGPEVSVAVAASEMVS